MAHIPPYWKWLRSNRRPVRIHGWTARFGPPTNTALHHSVFVFVYDGDRVLLEQDMKIADTQPGGALYALLALVS